MLALHRRGPAEKEGCDVDSTKEVQRLQGRDLGLGLGRQKGVVVVLHKLVAIVAVLGVLTVFVLRASTPGRLDDGTAGTQERLGDGTLLLRRHCLRDVALGVS